MTYEEFLSYGIFFGDTVYNNNLLYLYMVDAQDIEIVGNVYENEELILSPKVV